MADKRDNFYEWVQRNASGAEIGRAVMTRVYDDKNFRWSAVEASNTTSIPIRFFVEDWSVTPIASLSDTIQPGGSAVYPVPPQFANRSVEDFRWGGVGA